MKIQVSDQQHKIVFELNNSDAATSLVKQLPINTKIENYSNNEKIFYPSKLTTINTPLSQGQVGDLAYFAPWGDVVLYYKEFQSCSGLYQLGKCISGKNEISRLSGNVTIEQI